MLHSEAERHRKALWPNEEERKLILWLAGYQYQILKQCLPISREAVAVQLLA